MTTAAVDSPRKEADAVLGALVEHWARARIDNPLHVIARLDDAAKHILVVAGILQGILIAVVKIEPLTPRQLSGFSIAALTGLVIAALLATLALFVQSNHLETHPIYKKVRTYATDAEFLDSLDGEIENWCLNNDRVRRRKHVLLAMAMLSLVASMSFSLVCVWKAMYPSGGTPSAPVVAAAVPLPPAPVATPR
jgi:hypothetical protein